MPTLNLLPKRIDISWRRGDGFTRGAFQYVDVDGDAINLTGFTASLLIAPSVAEAATVTFTHGSGITLTEATGTIEPSATATQMADVTTLGAGSYVYELIVDDGAGDVRTIAAGTFLSEDDIGV